MDPGTQLGPYEIKEPLGQGGMGEVYRARDRKLDRDVAIKVLPAELADDPERLARLEREARLLAALNHPGIATVYGFEEHDGTRFIVMELVEGETLAERLEEGPLPVEEALDLGVQIAKALEAAHQQGIVHRDLKPGNIKVASDGLVKVLDFGLAKPSEAVEERADEEGLSRSPTLTVAGTEAGVILGTVPYMSPEQARGEEVDQRTDVWAFGCLLYEMLTGRRPFLGEDVSETLAAILRDEPDWEALPASTPLMVQALLRRCLRRDSKRRLHDIADARLEIDEALSEPWPRWLENRAGPPQESTPFPVWRRMVPWAVTGIALVVAAGALLSGGPGDGPVDSRTLERPVRLSLELPADQVLDLETDTPFAVSPDGDQIVYALEEDGSPLWKRALDRFDAEPIPGTEGASRPFFSPNGRWVGFYRDGKLSKISLAGGPPVPLADASGSFRPMWAPDGRIIFDIPLGSSSPGIVQVPASGGTPEPLTSLDGAADELGHHSPQLLPDGDTLLFSIGSGRAYGWERIVARSLTTGERKVVLEQGGYPLYLPTGQLLFDRGGVVHVVGFDPETLSVVGSPIPVLRVATGSRYVSGGQFSVSRSGTLVYVPYEGETDAWTAVWVDRNGSVEPVIERNERIMEPRLSPDGRWMALALISTEGKPDVWLYDLQGNAWSRLTNDGESAWPVWSPNGRWVTFTSRRDDQWNLFRIRADGSGSAERLTRSDYPQSPGSWLPGEELLAFNTIHPDTGNDLWLLSLQGDRTPQPFLATPADEVGGRFSPDGRWVGYHSNESGQWEVYATPYPGPGPKIKISAEGGTDPVWSADGSEIFYRDGDQVMAVSVQVGGEFSTGEPRSLFEGHYEAFASHGNYHVAPGGDRFLMIRPPANLRAGTRLNVVLNWFDELERVVPTRE